MSEAKTNARTLQFPQAEDTPLKRPAWLEQRQATPARNLFEPAGDQATRPPSLSPDRHPAAPHQPSELPHAQHPPAQHAPPQHGQPDAAHAQHAPPNAASTPRDAGAGSHAGSAQDAQPQQAGAHQATPDAAAQRHAGAGRSNMADAPPAQHAEPDDMEHGLDERAWSKLPGPPQLGSLIPGARSAPPPANDTGLEFLREQREAFANAAVELGIARAATLSVLEGQLLDLAIEIASALIEREIEREPELHGTLARAALSSLGDSERVMLRTSPDAYEAICQTLGGSEVTTRGVHVQVHADATIPGLGCVVDGDNVRIDATVAERLRAVRRAFEEERRKVAESSE